MIFKVVVLPEPFGPTKQSSSCLSDFQCDIFENFLFPVRFLNHAKLDHSNCTLFPRPSNLKIIRIEKEVTTRIAESTFEAKDPRPLACILPMAWSESRLEDFPQTSELLQTHPSPEPTSSPNQPGRHLRPDGRVTVKKTPNLEGFSNLALSTSFLSTFSNAAFDDRKTKGDATKNCDRTTASVLPGKIMPSCRSSGPRRPLGAKASKSARPATAGGRIIGTSNTASRTDFPLKFLVANKYAVGTPKTKDTQEESNDVTTPRLSASMTSAFCNSKIIFVTSRL